MSLWVRSLIAFFHPALMLVTLAGTVYALFLGIQTRRTRNAPSEIRKEMVKSRYSFRHFYAGSGLLVFWVIGSLMGMTATYALYDQLFLSPHLLGGLSIVGLASFAAALVPPMKQGKQWARDAHIAVVSVIMVISISQTVTGIEIIQDILEKRF